MDWLLTNARLTDRAELVDIAIADGRIAQIRPAGYGPVSGPAAQRWELDRRVVLPGLVDIHVHLDKTYLNSSGSFPNRSGTLLEAIDIWRAAQQHHTERCFALAAEYDRDLHFVCDDVADPNSRSLEMVARQTLATDWQGRVAATQCAALAFYDDAYAAQVVGLVREAGMTILSNSHVSLIATDFPDRQPWPRSITRVRELLDAGVPVACGQDDIDNWFYPFGRNDLLEVAQFMAHNGRFAWHGEVDRVLPLITSTPARLLGLGDYGLHVGAEANLVVLDAPDWHQAIQFQAEKRFVILRGKLAVESQRIVKMQETI